MMADIFAILHGQPSWDALCAMTLADIARWHARAAARASRDR